MESANGIKMIIIRKAKKGDGKGIAESFNNGLKRGLNKYTGGNMPFDKKKIRKMEKDFSKYNKHKCCYVALDNKKIIGSCIFSGKDKGRLRHRVELGWGIHPDYIRKGLATRMVKRLIEEARKRGFKKIEAEAACENISSVKLAKKLGFKIEGRKKAGLLLDNGKYVDTYVFGKILR